MNYLALLLFLAASLASCGKKAPTTQANNWVKVTRVAPTELTLQWAAFPSANTRYQLYQSSAGPLTDTASLRQSGDPIGKLVAVTEKTVTDLTPDTVYYFNILAHPPPTAQNDQQPSQQAQQVPGENPLYLGVTITTPSQPPKDQSLQEEVKVAIHQDVPENEQPAAKETETEETTTDDPSAEPQSEPESGRTFGEDASLLIAGGDHVTTDSVVLLSLEAENAAQMYLTNIPTCQEGGQWEEFRETKAWVLPQENTEARVYAKFRDEVGNESLCINDGITHDTIPPSEASIKIANGAELTNQPSVTLALEATGASEMALIAGTDCGENIAWEPYAPEKIWALETKNTDHSVAVVFRDEAGNISECQSATIFYDGTPPSQPSIQINAGEETTYKLQLDLSLIAVGAKFMLISDHSDCSGAIKSEYSAGRSWTAKLPLGVEPIKVYVKYEDENGNQTACVGDEIRLVDRISADYVHTCAMDRGNQLRCWGSNSWAQNGSGLPDPLGDNPGEVLSDATLVDLGSGQTVREIGTGNSHTCALLSNASVKCWGANSSGQSAAGNTTSYGDQVGEVATMPVADLGRPVAKIYGDSKHSCAILDNGAATCWGYNKNNLLARGDNSDEKIGDEAEELGYHPVDLGGHTVLQLALANDHICALLDDSQVKCWGSNRYGQLGVSGGDVFQEAQMGDNLRPVPLGVGVRQIAASYKFSCALLENGKVKCWGANDYGQLGTGNIASTKDQDLAQSPYVSLGEGRTARQIRAAHNRACAILDDQSVKCWGANFSDGVLGYPNTSNDKSMIGDTPEELGDGLPPVNLGGPVVSLGLGVYHSCAYLGTGEVKCWGGNYSGILGHGDTLPRGGGADDMANLPVTLTE